MNYRFVYAGNYHLVIPAVIIDARQGTSLQDKIGDVIKAYTDAEVAKVQTGVIPYRIETDLGNLAGYLTLKKENFGNSASILQLVLRVQFQQFADEVTTQVLIFMSAGDWMFDIL